MNIKAARNLPYNGFPLDSDSIQLRSISTENICLPYVGTLPDRIKAESAYVALQIRPNYPKCLIVCECSDGKQRSYLIEYTTAEITMLLDRFFYDSDENVRLDTGLELFPLGLWLAHYEDWRVTAAK